MSQSPPNAYKVLFLTFGFIVGMHLSSPWLCKLNFVLCILSITGYIIFRKKFFLLLLLSASLIFVGNFYCNSFFNNQLHHFNVRKHTELVLRLDSVVEKNTNNTVYGYAHIIKAPMKLNSVQNKEVYYILDTDCAGICPGQQVKVSCKLVHISPRSRKGFSQFLFKNHIFLYCCDGRICEILTNASWFQKQCTRARDMIFSILGNGVNGDKNSSILIGMLTGSKYKITRSQRADFCTAGVAHIFAISGLHIGIIALCLDKIFRILLIPKRIRTFPVLGILVIYINIIGPSPSSVRACLMVMLYYASILIGRQPNLMSIFSNSLLIHILYRPSIVYNISFLLSYCVVFGIIVIASPLANIAQNMLIINEIQNFHNTKIWQKILSFIKKYLLCSICTSSAAYASSLLVSIEFFGQISWLTILFNILIIPLSSLSIILGTLSIACGMLHLNIICAYINRAAVFPIGLIGRCFDCTRGINHGAIILHPPPHGSWLLGILAIAATGYIISLLNDRIITARQNESRGFSANSFNFLS